VVGRVVSLQVVPEHGNPPRPVPQVQAVVGVGLLGDVHARGRSSRSRQVLLVDVSALRTLGLRPGDLREQVTVDLPGLDALPAGTRLQVGQAVCELTGPCEPCIHIGMLVGVSDPRGLRQRLAGRRGQLAMVVATAGEGWIRVGDPITPL
jgi:hypothetical protein